MATAAGAEGEGATRSRSERSAGSSLLAAPVLVVFAVLASPSVDPRGESARPAPVQGQAGTPTSSIAALEGEWRRNERISEDPIRKTAGLWREPDRASAVLTGLSASLAERLGKLRLHAADGHVHVRNARFETLALPTDGSTVTDQYGNRHRALILPGALEIETARPDWLLIETFYRQAGELHRVIEIQSASFPNLRFLTVYEWDGDGSPGAVSAAGGAGRFVRPATILIVPPRGSRRELLGGGIEVETLTVDRSIGSVDFLLDGRRVGRARKLPFRSRIDLAEPPREQILEARAYSVRGAFMGGDSLVLNRIDPPFGIRIEAVTTSEPDGASVQVETRVAVPRGAVLERVDFYRNESFAASEVPPQRGAGGGFGTVSGSLSTPGLSPNDYVRVVAALADGRELEDAQLIEGVTFKGEIDVQLVHLQVLVVDEGGSPVDGLTSADFRIVEDGEWKTVENVRQAGEVPLLLGMAIDSSASMRPIWGQLRSVAGTFLETSLGTDDRAFLVDFDESVRLLQRPTGSPRALRTGMDRLIPNGGTALNDGILFSLILYGDEPGRRALVVVTDGVDIDSRSAPEQAAIFAERVGIPLYLIDLGRDRIALPNGGDPDGGPAAAPLIRTARSADHVSRMRRQARRSGGRLFRIDPELAPPEFLGQVRRVFERIKEDLRRQQVLTYYTSRPIGAAIEPEVQAARKGLTVKSVLPLDRVDADPVGTRREGPGTTEYTFTATDAALPSSSEAAPVPFPDEGATVSFSSEDASVTVAAPSFGGAAIPDQAWVQHEALTPLTFPAASGGGGEFVYGLAPPLPAGLSFDLATRVLWGTPSTPRPATGYAYTATDANGNAATLSFSITVRAAARDEPAVARDDGAVVSVLGLPSRMAVGGAATVTVTVTNSGTTTWTPLGGYGLGSRSPRDNETWGLRRAPLFGSVAPNEKVSFEFPITAPRTPGAYTFAWRMVRDPGAWFGSGTGDLTVSVEEP
ncbi:MAG: VWA domain-containing protein [Acidobacteriota bacterium]|nr:VWA domain-containing protein [Acidobacteriota bacterium]